MVPPPPPLVDKSPRTHLTELHALPDISENVLRSCKVLCKYSSNLLAVVDDMWTTEGKCQDDDREKYETLINWRQSDLRVNSVGMLSLLLLTALFSGGMVKTMQWKSRWCWHALFKCENWVQLDFKFSGLSAQYNYRYGEDYGTNWADYMEYGGDYAEDYDIGGPGTEYGNDWADFASAQLGIDYGIADSRFDAAFRDYSSPPGRQTLIINA